MAGVQHEQHPWGELDQADQAQVQYVAGQLVEVPADGHGEHLEAAGGEHAGQPEGQERAVVTQQLRCGIGHRKPGASAQ
ncbi:hypothetical protein D3C84_1198850 [compost metagenome]